MQNPIQVSPQEFVESLKEQTEGYLKAVMEAVNLAPDGQWIAGSEEQVRDLSEDFRRLEAGEVVRHEAQRLQFSSADERVANVDGADWIREQLRADAEALPLDGLGLDFYHLSENVHKCRREVFGSENASGDEWAKEILHTFKHEGYGVAWECLLHWRVTLSDSSAPKKSAADRLFNYVQERAEMIGYPTFRERGWQIGSGPTESRCKTTTSRLKGRGRRWDPENAEAVAAHTTLRDSNQWQAYWMIPETKAA